MPALTDGRSEAVARGERAPDTVVAIEIARCALPLEHPVRIGATVYREREYAALRLVTANGTQGHAIGYTRGLPLDAMLRMLVDDLLGCRAWQRPAVLQRMRRAHLNAAGSLGRAFSLVDIALADAEARLAGRPLWRLLGEARSRVPLMVVAGYDATERGAESVLDEVRSLVDEGFRHVKLHTSDAAIVAHVRARIDAQVRIGVDAGFAWEALPAAMEACRPLDELGLAFIEDPFPPERWRLSAELRDRLRTPLAAGEDAADPWLLGELARSVDVLRVDATVSGGVAGVLEAATIAREHGASVMTHAFPDQSAHLAGAGSVGMVEMIPDASGLNPVGGLLARRQAVEDGELVLSEEPGHGAPLDWERVVGAAKDVTSHRIGQEEGTKCS